LKGEINGMDFDMIDQTLIRYSAFVIHFTGKNRNTAQQYTIQCSKTSYGAAVHHTVQMNTTRFSRS
jgi:hypothetical protein